MLVSETVPVSVMYQANSTKAHCPVPHKNSAADQCSDTCQPLPNLTHRPNSPNIQLSCCFLESTKPPTLHLIAATKTSSSKLGAWCICAHSNHPDHRDVRLVLTTRINCATWAHACTSKRQPTATDRLQSHDVPHRQKLHHSWAPQNHV